MYCWQSSEGLTKPTERPRRHKNVNSLATAQARPFRARSSSVTFQTIVDHAWLLRRLVHRIARVLRLIGQWLRAGIR